ncbi:hypothetical protein ACS0TY_031507 [Phlomoides rotata]
MAVSASEECQDNVVVLTDVTTNMQSEPPLNISYLEVPSLMKSETCLNSVSNLHNHSLEVDEVHNLATCVVDVDIEKGKGEILKFSDDCVANLKSDDSLARVLQREICLQVGGKFMQLLMKHGTELPKFASRERAYDTPANRSRKFKRSSSFNSRRVLLMFSVLSSMGTIILIYLTLRVRQISDGSGNV